MLRNSFTALVTILCLGNISTADEIPPILLASENGVQLWSQPVDAPRDGMLSATVYLQTENPIASIASVESLRIDNVQKIATRIGEHVFPATASCRDPRGTIYADFTYCEFASTLSFTSNHITSERYNLNLAETNDASYGDLGFPTLPTTATYVAGLGSISTTSPLDPLSFESNFYPKQIEIGYLVTQQQPPQTTISIGVSTLEADGVDATRNVLFDSIPVMFVPETSPTLWQILTVLMLLRFRFYR